MMAKSHIALAWWANNWVSDRLFLMPTQVSSAIFRREVVNFYWNAVMVSVLAWSAVDREFEPKSGQTKDYLIGISCFTAKHAAIRRKSKDWLARNPHNVSQWGDMSIRGLLFSVN
jgi:hypothetical protein